MRRYLYLLLAVFIMAFSLSSGYAQVGVSPTQRKILDNSNKKKVSARSAASTSSQAKAPAVSSTSSVVQSSMANTDSSRVPTSTTSARVMGAQKTQALKELGPGSKSAVCARYQKNCDKLYDEKAGKFKNADCEKYAAECVEFMGITDAKCIEKMDRCIAQFCYPEEVCSDYDTTMELVKSCLTDLGGFERYACKERQLKASVKKMNSIVQSKSAQAKAQSEADSYKAQVAKLQQQNEKQQADAQAAIERARQEAVEAASAALAPSSAQGLIAEAQAEKPEFSLPDEYNNCYSKYQRAYNLMQTVETYSNCQIDGKNPKMYLQADANNFDVLDLLSMVGNSRESTDICQNLPPRLKMSRYKIHDMTAAVNEYKSCVSDVLKKANKEDGANKSSITNLTKLLTFLRTSNVNNIADRMDAFNFISPRADATGIYQYYPETVITFKSPEGLVVPSGNKTEMSDVRSDAKIMLSASIYYARTLMNLTEFVNEEFEKYAAGSNVDIKVAQSQTGKDCNTLKGEERLYCIQMGAIEAATDLKANYATNRSVAQRAIASLKNYGYQVGKGPDCASITIPTQNEIDGRNADGTTFDNKAVLKTFTDSVEKCINAITQATYTPTQTQSGINPFNPWTWGGGSYNTIPSGTEPIQSPF